MAPAVAGPQETPIKSEEKRISQRSRRLRDNNEKQCGTMKTVPARLSPPYRRARMKKPGAVSRPGVLCSLMRSFR
jgi:hypothetical protein